MPVTKSNQSRVAYIHKDGVWYPMIGIASTSVNYNWTGTHVFENNPVTFEEVVKAQGGVNNFADETARDAAIPTPDAGTVAFVRSVNGVANTNQIQYYSGSAWVNYADASFIPKTSNYTISLSDSAKTITVNSGSAVTITIPANATVPFPIGTRIDIVGLGSGTVDVAAASNVTINSKNSWKKLNAQYSGATVMKIDTNTWVLIGDLKS